MTIDYPSCVKALKRECRDWLITMTAHDLSSWLADHYSVSDLLTIYTEALYLKKAGVRGLPRRIATRLSVASYVLLPSRLCRALWVDLVREHEDARLGIARMGQEEWDRLLDIMKA